MGLRGVTHHAALTAILVVLFHLHLRSCLVLGDVLHARQNAPEPLPTPLTIQPSQDWDGIDGRWNTFPLRIGTPEQYTRALISTASQQTWAVYDKGCYENVTDPNDPSKQVEEVNKSCYDSRGRTFNMDKSKTWNDVGFYQLWLEKNLGLWGNGKYGYETVGLGYTAQDGPTLENTTVGALITDNFWLGHFGINPKPTNFSAFADPSPSYMTYLFEQSKIPSVSWGYTAGAEYRLGTVLGSLVLGGYDSSRFIPNDLTFAFAPDNERDIVVGVVDIQVDSETMSDVSLLDRDPFTMYIDSTVAELYLPTEVCKAFEKELGLKYDNATQLYLVDDLLHETLLADNATITFSLGQKYASNATIDIKLPYAALDLTAKPPYKGLQNATRYFPIRRAEKENAFVLGRTFLQEAYLIVDWERQNFSVSQNKWVYGEKPNILSIVSPVFTGEMVETNPEGANRLSTGAIIGIAIGAGFGFAMVVIGIGWWCWRRRVKNKREKVKAKYAAETDAEAGTKKEQVEKCEETPISPINEENGTIVFPKAELPAEAPSGSASSGDSKDGDSSGAGGLPSPTFEVDNTERQIFEMPGDIPARQEADGRQLSEKETMMVRERIYNGVDPYSPPPVSPISTEAPRRPPPILSPSDVTMVNRRMAASIPPSISPTSPRTPRDGSSLGANDTFFHFQPTRTPRDGRFLEAEDTLLSPISPLEDTSRRRFSYES